MKRIFVAVACVVACWMVWSPIEAQSPADARFESLASLVQEKMREHRVPGVALGVLEHGTITTRGFGVTSVDDPLPITEHTVFPIASISKTFAATAMLRLVEQGKVDLRAPVRTYLRDFRVQDEAVSRDVTIWHLLTHASGWEGQVAGPERGDETLKNFVGTIGGLMQLAPPGAAWSYNNAGFSVAGRVIEAVTGTSINAAIRDLVFKPVGLVHAGTTAGEFITNRFALGHANRAESAPTVQRPFVPSTSVTAGGVGLCITDLLSYAKFHLGDGTAAGERVLNRSTLEDMRKPQLHKQGTDDDIGIAWHLRTVGPIRTAAHGGTLAGHILLLELVPERNFAIGILTNANNGWRLIQDVERAALKAYHGATFSTNQAIAHRGLVETLPVVEPLATQPDPAPYVGRYLRPMNAVVVRADNRRLFVQVLPTSGNPQPEMPVAFYGPDRAVVTEGTDRGQSIEFVRTPDGGVNWIRVVGRIAVRAASQPSSQPAAYDVVLRNGRVMDPASGLDAVRNVAIAGKKIAAISAEPLRARVEVDATGLVVAPGFIDLHSHGQTPENYRYKAMDGVTTALELEVGVSPVSAWYKAREGRALINFGASAGHIPARMAVMKDTGSLLPRDAAMNRPATAEEQQAIEAAVQRDLDEGGVGLGMGITYTPTATADEILSLFNLAARFRRPVFVHMRGGNVVTSLQEVIADAAASGTAVHVVHINSAATAKTPIALQIVSGARARGLDVTTEAYPYTASMTEIASAAYTGWEQRGPEFFARLLWPATGERLTRESFERYHKQGGFVISFGNTEEMVRAAVAHPDVMIASDGVIENGKGHPRGAGTFARVLGKYVREEKALTLMDAIRKSSLMPARRLEVMSPQMRQKGRLEVGADADIAVFDPGRVIDKATFENAAQYSDGFRYVLVEGTFVVRDGKLQDGVTPGQGIRAQ